MQQVLEAVKAAGMESRKVQTYLPDFLKKLREDLEKELNADPSEQSANQVQTPGNTSASVAVAYQTVSQTSISLSIQS